MEVKMTLKGYLRYVEIQTKVASIIPFLLGTLYAKYRYSAFNTINFLVMLISLLAFDMATTAINNYVDFKHTPLSEDNALNGTAYIREGISEKTGIEIIYILLTIAIVFGIILTLRTNIVVLLIGALAFGVGVFYTYGPIPISRMPLGEVFSGFFMGFIILFLSIYIHIYNIGLVELSLKSWNLSMNVNIKECLYIFMMSIPGVGGISNIMLANNICDIDEDIKIKRYTLPYYIGKAKALLVFRITYYIGYADIILLLALKIAPITFVVVLLTALPVNRAINAFNKKQEKSSTFVLSIKNFIMMTGSQVLLIALAILFRLI